jgi:uncharacterized protein (DUF427 family)
MARATFHGAVLAESDRVRIVEGNVYFPPDAVRTEHLIDSPTHTVCSWKGTASYYHVVVAGETNRDAAWYYPSTSAAAKEIEGYVAFWKGVTVER